MDTHPTLTLTVKGNRYVAAKAASQRNIPAVFVRELQRASETVLRVGIQHREKVAKWFAEPHTGGGTLLFFSESQSGTV